MKIKKYEKIHLFIYDVFNIILYMIKYNVFRRTFRRLKIGVTNSIIIS